MYLKICQDFYFVKFRHRHEHTAQTRLIQEPSEVRLMNKLGKWRTTADTYGLVKKAGWRMNEWPIFQSHLGVSPDCLLAWFHLPLPPPLIVHDDWKDDGEGVTCNQDWLQGQEMNLWQDLFLSSVSRITGESRTSPSTIVFVIILYQTDWRSWQTISFVLFSVEKHMHHHVFTLKKDNKS